MRDLLKTLAATYIAMAIAGCAHQAERQPAVAAPVTPEAWVSSPQENGTILGHWLQIFGDPILQQLVQGALDNNYDLKSVAARIAAAKAQYRIDGSGRWPQLSLQQGYQRERMPLADGGGGETGAFQTLFDLSWELDVWGRIRAGQLASGQEAEAARADWNGARLSLAARTAQNYFELAEARLQVQVAEQSIKDRRTLAELLRGRFERGLTRALDLRLALTDVANAEAQLATQRIRVQDLARNLEVLLGRYPSGHFNQAQALPQLTTRLQTGIPAQLLERRPDLIAAFARLRAADKRLESARKALLPRFTLAASGGAGAAALADLADPRAAAWNLALGLLQPIFTGGRLRGDIQLRNARVEEALNHYRETVLNAFREVEQALAAEARFREQEQALREAVRQTDASRKLAVYSYRLGLIEILTLLDSYRSTLNARSAHLTAQRQLLNNRIDLYLALGGGI